MSESYPPRIEDLQTAFLTLHPDYRFSAVGIGHDQRGWDPCPLEVDGKNVWGGMSAGGVCDQNGARHNEWCKYIGDRGRELVTEAGIAMPPWGQMSVDPFRHLRLCIQWYREICRNPAVTPEARLSRERSRAAAIRMETERQERAEQQRLAAVAWAAKEEETRKEKARLFQLELAAAKASAAVAPTPVLGGMKMTKNGTWAYAATEADMAHARHMEDCRKRDVLITRHGLTPSDAEAVLAHLTWTRLGCSFHKDTLAAVRAIGDFARANGIRVRDAEQLLQEVAGPRPPPVREEPLDQSPSLSLTAGGCAAPAVRKAIPKKIRGEAWKAQFGSSTEGSCYCCRKELDIFDDWHAGHIVPAARGGPDTADNLRPLCGSCNLAMGTEHMDLFKVRCYPA